MGCEASYRKRGKAGFKRYLKDDSVYGTCVLLSLAVLVHPARFLSATSYILLTICSVGLCPNRFGREHFLSYRAARKTVIMSAVCSGLLVWLLCSLSLKRFSTRRFSSKLLALLVTNGSVGLISPLCGSCNFFSVSQLKFALKNTFPLRNLLTLSK